MKLTGLLSLLLIFSGCGSSQQTEILWDSWGVLHIYSGTGEGLFHALG